MSEEIVYESIYNEFSMYFPPMAEEMVEWYKSGGMEITVILSDETKVVYDGLEHTMRRIPKRDESYRMDEETFRREFAYNLYRMMDLKKINQKQLAELTGISNVSLSKYLNQKVTPSARTVYLLTKALKCDFDDLIREY